MQIAPKGESVTVLRSGPQVPVRLPRGFTLFPDAEVLSNTVVERGAARRILVVFETGEAIDKVMAFYRGQARAAGIPLAFDLGGDEQASLGGRLPTGGKLTVSARREGSATRVELAAS